jgi:hypothetical protein
MVYTMVWKQYQSPAQPDLLGPARPEGCLQPKKKLSTRMVKRSEKLKQDAKAQMTYRGLGLTRGGLALIPAFIVGMKPCSAFHPSGGSLARPTMPLIRSLDAKTGRYLSSAGITASRSFHSRHRLYTSEKGRNYQNSFFSRPKNHALLGGAAAGFGTWLIWQGGELCFMYERELFPFSFRLHAILLEKRVFGFVYFYLGFIVYIY